MENDFLHVLQKTPGDLLARMAYADWLEENYRNMDAFAQRWMVAWKKWPVLRERTRPHQRIVKPWAWHVYRYSATRELDDAYAEDRARPNWLPPLVFRALSRRALFSEQMLYDTAYQAEQALVLAIKRGAYEFGLAPYVSSNKAFAGG